MALAAVHHRRRKSRQQQGGRYLHTSSTVKYPTTFNFHCRRQLFYQCAEKNQDRAITVVLPLFSIV